MNQGPSPGLPVVKEKLEMYIAQMTVGTHPDTPRSLGWSTKVCKDDISTAKELAVCEKDPELKNLMTSACSSFMTLGYNIPSVLEKQFALKSLEKSLDSREVEEGASKIGTCRFVVQKILVSCASHPIHFRNEGQRKY